MKITHAGVGYLSSLRKYQPALIIKELPRGVAETTEAKLVEFVLGG